MNFKFFPHYIQLNGHTHGVHNYWIVAGAQEDDLEFSFTAVASTFIAECGYHILDSVVETEHGNAEDHFAIAVREHGDTRADEDVDNRPIVGHLPMLFHW